MSLKLLKQNLYVIGLRNYLLLLTGFLFLNSLASSNFVYLYQSQGILLPLFVNAACIWMLSVWNPQSTNEIKQFFQTGVIALCLSLILTLIATLSELSGRYNQGHAVEELVKSGGYITALHSVLIFTALFVPFYSKINFRSQEQG